MAVLNCCGVVQVTFDGETFIIENHHSHYIWCVLKLNILLKYKICISLLKIKGTLNIFLLNKGHFSLLLFDILYSLTIILLMTSPMSSLHSTMLLLDTTLLADADILLLELLLRLDIF